VLAISVAATLNPCWMHKKRSKPFTILGLKRRLPRCEQVSISLALGYDAYTLVSDRLPVRFMKVTGVSIVRVDGLSEYTTKPLPVAMAFKREEFFLASALMASNRLK
jgi:hypothetical protein